MHQMGPNFTHLFLRALLPGTPKISPNGDLEGEIFDDICRFSRYLKQGICTRAVACLVFASRISITNQIARNIVVRVNFLDFGINMAAHMNF